jgi:hypothetical protein
MNDLPEQANPLPGSVRVIGRLEPLLLTNLANAWFMKDWLGAFRNEKGEYVGFI